MKSPLRWIARIFFLAVVLVFLLCGLVLAKFTSWRADKIAALQGASELVETAAGTVEYLTGGEGPAVLVCHGAPGGFDQAMLLGAGLRDDGFQIIAPSRPGYLRTPLTSGLLYMQQADAMAALLDDLGIQSVSLLGFSEGAPVAIYFARKYPDRVASMALISPVTKPFNPTAAEAIGQVQFGKAILRGLTGDVGAWIAFEIAERDPRRGVEWLLKLTSTMSETERATSAHIIAANLDQRYWYSSLIGTFNPLSLRETGARNDLIQSGALQDFPATLKKITTPTLFIQGEKDSCVPMADTLEAVKAIPGATLVTVPGAGHIVQLGGQAPDVQKKLTEFFRQYTGGQGHP
jgi:pimeloyl-ACP methyl ester carboxylesterase